MPTLLKKAQELYKDLRFAIFDDVLPALKIIKERALTTGLLTNLDRDMKLIYGQLGLEPYIDFVVTSGEAGADKPKPPIFLTALERAGVAAGEAVHVGDQYQIDVVGAQGVGINPMLLDRYNQYPDVSDCPRISSLTELTGYL
jgi:putative hydrolase of the HAD superfamily